DLTLDVGLRRRTASELTNLAMVGLFDRPADYQTARRLVGLALQLDPSNARAKGVQRQLDNGESTSFRRQNIHLVDKWRSEVRATAEAAAKCQDDPDRKLAAYLYTSLSLAFPDDSGDDAHQAAQLARQGYAVSWTIVDTASTRPSEPTKLSPPLPHPHPVISRDPPKLKPITEIRGLVVQVALDGREHGRATDIIASADSAGARRGIRLIGQVGQEMKTSLEEAVRTVRLRHADVDRASVEISFDDKYTAKDGGSAAGAFTLLLLAAYGDFEVNPQAAITGDITVDGKIRPVGAIPAKVHGAAMDQCKLVAIPASNTDEMSDAILLQGASSLWEVQIFSCQTLDDAIAVMRKDPDPKLVEAMKLFDQLRTDYQKKAPVALRAPKAQEALAKILSLAPNHVSAALLQQLSQGKGPAH